jgi:hypothetical protein
MSTATDVLSKLYDKVVVKANKLKPEEIEEKNDKKFYKTSSTPFQQSTGIDTEFQAKSSEHPYKTNAGIGDLPAGGGGHNAGSLPSNASTEPFDYSPDAETGKKKKVMRTKDGEEFEVREQEGDETPVSAEEEEGGDPTEGMGSDMELPADPATTDPSMNAEQPGGEDMGMGGMDDMGGDMGGMGMEEEQKNPHELGRIYEMKKIYTRLTSIESYLSAEADPELTEVRKYVSQSIELFEIVASNIDSYKDKMDEIIISYYKFLKEIYYKIRVYYKNKQSQMEEV